MSKDLIVLYVDMDSPTPEDVPSVSLPYKSIGHFKKVNEDLKPLASFSKNHLLEEWGVQSEIDNLKERVVIAELLISRMQGLSSNEPLKDPLYTINPSFQLMKCLTGFVNEATNSELMEKMKIHGWDKK